ncbi:MAG: aminoacetone oxidase family FAD-binding enzyme [Clostridia bacterium]|nr:aminoacetone oxidase family FAD-binding enzyme [Clostridia bacterium]
MERIKIAIIGGGASGLMLANALAEQEYANATTAKTVVFERGERVGKKLSSTGNGQGNITNLRVLEEQDGYFSLNGQRGGLAYLLLREYDNTNMERFWTKRGVALTYDERGRAYPSGRQASALTDALRFYAADKGIELRTGARVYAVKKDGNGFALTYEKEGSTHTCYAEKVVLCAGGKAAKNFGTDGSAYALAEGFGHTVTPLYPSLVQLKTDTSHIKSLKGIRVTDGGLTARTGSKEYRLQGDIIFTDYGVSGDAVFRISAFITPEIPKGEVSLSIDFLPNTDEKTILGLLESKRAIYPHLDNAELLFGIVNNQVGRAILRRANGNLKTAAKLVKAFPLQVTGSLGFDYAQVTKGGIPLSEINDNLESRLVDGLYFAGEILDVDGQCGGFNLQWAYASARKVAAALSEEIV